MTRGPALSEARLARFARHIVLPEIGGAGQVSLAGRHLVLIGLGYGATIARYPAITLSYFGPSQMARSYGRVFTAWGVAGLVAPWAAGRLYDLDGDYTTSCLVATGVVLIAAATAAMMPRREPRREAAEDRRTF